MKINKVLLDQNLTSMEEVFMCAATALKAENLITDIDAYIAALQAREAQGTTGMIDGIAIPHGKGDAVKESAVIYIRNKVGIEWNSLDGSLITDIFVLAIEPNNNDHLDSLIAISSNLMDDDQRTKLRALNDETSIASIFE